LSNGCVIEGCATSSDAARGKSANVLILDEAAFVPVHLMEDLWTSVYPIISSAKNTKCIMVSTPNGTGNLYYTTYTNAVLSKDVDGEKWIPIRIDWWDVPGRDEEWKQKQLVGFNYDMRKWNQEYGNEFLGSTLTLVDIERMSTRKAELFKLPPVHQDFPIKEYKCKVWEPPERDRVYVIGVDVADGTGNDYSVATVYDITTPTKGVKQVASFDNNKISPSKLAFVVAKLGAYYNVAPLMIEYNNMGETVVEFLHLLYEYPNIASIGHHKLGIRSHKNLKIDACQNFRDLFDGEFINVEVNEMLLLTQLEYFEKKVVGGGGSDFTYRAAAGNNDDQVLANVWALYIIKRANLDYFFDADYTMIGMREFPVYCQQFNDSWVADQRDILMKIDTTYDEIHNKEAANLNEAYGLGMDDDPDYIRSL
jgi:hypothetical protein